MAPGHSGGYHMLPCCLAVVFSGLTSVFLVIHDKIRNLAMVGRTSFDFWKRVVLVTFPSLGQNTYTSNSKFSFKEKTFIWAHDFNGFSLWFPVSKAKMACTKAWQPRSREKGGVRKDICPSRLQLLQVTTHRMTHLLIACSATDLIDGWIPWWV